MSNQPFVHLHLHSEFSLLDGACKTNLIAARAAELEMSAVAVTDHGNMHATIEFYRSCLAASVKPIIGMEAYICSHDCREKRDGIAHTGHMVLLARNNIGYKNLIQLATAGNLVGFYHQPRIDHELLGKHSEGLIALTACIGGEIPKLIRAEDLEQARTICCMYQEMFGKDGFYLELQDHNTPAKPIYPDQPKVNKILHDISRELGIPLVATNDTHFMKRDDFEAHEVLISIGMKTTVEEHKQGGYTYSTEHYLKSPAEMALVFPDDLAAVENSARIADMCDVQIELDNPQLPEYEVAEGQTWDSTLKDICQEKLQHVYATRPEKYQEATERLNYELDIISKKNLSAYFLIVRDFLQWAREQGIIVGIRGSGAGAIVSYLSGICNLDPLEYKLWFERFLSLDRTSMPDIDCDFEDRRRAEVIDYVVKKYGQDHVAQVSTFSTLKPRQAVRDAARVMAIPLSTADMLSKAIGDVDKLQEAIEKNTQIKEWYDDDPVIRQLLDMAGKIQGLKRQVGTHAAAVVISKVPLVEIAPLQRTTDRSGIQTQWEYPMAEAAGLVKMDFLGLRTLTVLKDALAFIEKYHKVKIDLDSLPLTNKKAYELMARGNTAGVFQLESIGMRNALRQLRPDRITDVIAMVALYRPGPMGEIPKFCQGKHNKKSIRYLHPSLEPILNETYGVMVYQEQVMAIGKEVAGLNTVDSNNLLDALRKKKLDKMAKLKPVFLKGVVETSHFTANEANNLWELMEKFAEYAFNKAHSVCYGIIAYQTAYLKANYSVEFMAALLSTVTDSHDKINLYIAESRKLGIEVLPPDVNYSTDGFTIEDGKIRFGLYAIKNVGSNAVDSIVNARNEDGPFVDLFDFCCRVESSACNRTALEALIKSGATDSLPGNRAQKLAIMDNAIDLGQSAVRDKAAGQINLFGDIASSPQASITQIPHLPEYEEKQLLEMEKEFLGLYISNHPINNYFDQLSKYRTATVEELAEAQEDDEVIIGGMLTSVKPYTMKNGKKMGFLSLDDLTGNIEVVAFNDSYEKSFDYLHTDKVVLIKGNVDFSSGRSYKVRKDNNEDDVEERPEAKLRAIAIAPIEDDDAIKVMLDTMPRKKNSNGYGSGNGRNAAPAISLPTFIPINYATTAIMREEIEEEIEMSTEDEPIEEATAACETTVCRMIVSEEFLKSADFEKLPSLLASLPGDSPLEIVVTKPQGEKRRWMIPNMKVNPAQLRRHLIMFNGASLE